MLFLIRIYEHNKCKAGSSCEVDGDLRQNRARRFKMDPKNQKCQPRLFAYNWDLCLKGQLIDDVPAIITYSHLSTKKKK